MRRLVGGGGVGLLYRQVPVVPRPIQPLGVGATACEVFLQNNMEMSVSRTDKTLEDSSQGQDVFVCGRFFSPC